MANRVLIGNRATGGYGLYVSKNGENVLNTTNSLAFDSRMGASAIVHSYGQGSLLGDTTVTITHNLGYNPLYALRWTDQGDISSGVATKTYSPNESSAVFAEYEEEEISDDGEVNWGCTTSNVAINSFLINNHSNNDFL